MTTAMRRRLKQGGQRSRYRLRKHIVEPVFGQIKAARGFRQLLLRGIDKARQEWALLCTAHNLVKTHDMTEESGTLKRRGRYGTRS